ncbi:MAG: imidazoleglycerol-phosphate dehydratase HisB [Spirochaetales bacterium]|nr:imidazoleglycerol-phosphate dehydratase HisB [Spirochaetales bacterium]
MIRVSKKERETKETSIKVDIAFPGNGDVKIETGVPFFSHMLTSMMFHGGFDCSILASGDIDVEPHHLVEDTGIVLGQAFKEIFNSNQGIKRFAESKIPMDEALSEAVIDVANRPYLVYRAEYPQDRCGEFDMSLCREFFYAFAVNSGITMHLNCLYGDNSHHMAEALFKAVGKALGIAFELKSDRPLSTKGVL